jgi:hypothetical protein
MERLLQAIEAIRKAWVPTGTPGYTSGTGGVTTTLTGKRMVSITVYAQTSAGTMTINGGNTITVRAGASFTFKPAIPYSEPVLVLSSSLDYMIEWVQ